MERSKFTDFVRGNIAEGQHFFADIIKTLLYKSDPDLFKLLDFYDDEPFLEPLLFAYFNSKESPIKPKQILFGYLEDELRPEIVNVFADESGIVYLPNIGYFVTNLANKELALIWDRSSKSYSLTYNDQPVNYSYDPIIRVEGTRIELCRYNHPLLAGLYTDTKGNVVDVEIQDSTRRHIPHLNTAFRILKTQYPHYYEDILAVTKKIVVFEGKNVNSFATLSAHGIAFLSSNRTDDEVFFIEDLAHQCGHVIFSALTSEKKAYFRADPDTPLKFLSKNPRETRTVYVTFHGLFTEAAMSEALDICYENDMFSGKQKHELAGRIAFILTRFSHDLANLAHSELFSEKGILLFNDFRQVFLELSQKRQDLLRKCDTSNQPYNFSYEKFVELNPLNGVV